ncbi:MAG: GntR family transcriptional regulator [Chloroflexi bacterium]|nr:GntR family transcriptional regulator [Chloroflexota bacterium]
MDVHIGSRVSLPVYAQLADQVKYLIQSGQLEPGARLPSPTHLARNLRINKHTIVKAYQQLERAGYVATFNGRGTFVTDAPRAAETQAHRELMRDLDGIVRHGLALGLTPRDLGNLVMMRAEAILATDATVSVLLLECNSRSLDYYANELRRELGIDVVPMLIDELDGDAALGTPPRAAACDIVICSFHHLVEFRRKIRRWPRLRSLELFAMAVRPHLEVVSRLMALPAGTRLGVVYCNDEPYAESRLQLMTDAVGRTILKNIEVTPILFDSAAPDPNAFDSVDALFVRPANIAAVRAGAPPGIEIVEFAYVLDSASSRMLREVVAEIRAQKAPSPPVVAPQSGASSMFGDRLADDFRPASSAIWEAPRG